MESQCHVFPPPSLFFFNSLLFLLYTLAIGICLLKYGFYDISKCSISSCPIYVVFITPLYDGYHER